MSEQHPMSSQILDTLVLQALLEVVGGGNAEETNAFIDDYCRDADALYAQLHSSLNQGDIRALAAAAHTFKSTSAQIGAMGLAEQCRQIEEAANHQQPHEHLETLLQKVAHEHEQVKIALESWKLS